MIELTLHPKKRVLKNTKYGIPFLGATIYHNHIIPGERLKKNMRTAFSEVVSGNRSIDTIPSYLGHLKHINSYKFIKKTFEDTGWQYEDDDCF